MDGRPPSLPPLSILPAAGKALAADGSLFLGGCGAGAFPGAGGGALGGLWNLGGVAPPITVGCAADPEICHSCGAPREAEVTEVSGNYHWVCAHCGVVGEEHTRYGKEVSVSVENRGSSGVRFVGGDKATQKKVSEVSGAGLEPVHLAPAILNALASRIPTSPYASPKIIERASALLQALLVAGKRPSVGGVEKLLAGCVYFASVEQSLCEPGSALEGSDAQITQFVKGSSAIVADRLGGKPGTKTTTSLVKSIGEVRKALARAGSCDRLPSAMKMDHVSAERAVRAFLAPLDATASGVSGPASGMGAVYAWGRTAALDAWGKGLDPTTPLVPALRSVEMRLARAVLDCQKWTQRESVGENRNHTTHWAAFASLVIEAYAAMGEARGGFDDYYRAERSEEKEADTGLLVSPKYLRVNPDYALSDHTSRVASGAIRLVVAASATNKAGGLKRPRPKKGDSEPLRPFPPRGRLLALNQKSVGQAVKDFVEEVRHYRRDLNVVLRSHGLYLPREGYWQERGLLNLGVVPA